MPGHDPKYESHPDSWVKNLAPGVRGFPKREIIPEKIFYSPRFDSEDKELGKDYLEKQLNKPIQQITRHNNTESLCKLSLEKIILNDKIRSWE